MATDAVAKELENLNRMLKEISSSLKEQNRLLKTMVHNYIEVHREPNDELLPPLKEDKADTPEVTEVATPTKIYGWSMAASVQREGELSVGDIKIENDESRWIWIGETWERVEPPSGQT